METAQGWYGKARKQRRAGKSLEPLIQAAQDDIAYLREVQASLEQLQGEAGEAGTDPDLAALQGIQVSLASNAVWTLYPVFSPSPQVLPDFLSLMRSRLKIEMEGKRLLEILRACSFHDVGCRQDSVSLDTVWTLLGQHSRLEASSKLSWGRCCLISHAEAFACRCC